MSLADVFSCSVETLCEDVPATNTFFYRKLSGSLGTFPALDLNTIFVTTLKPKILDILSSDTILMRVITRAVLAEAAVPYEANFDQNAKGTRGAEPLPPSLAGLFELVTTSINSRNNGHLYFAGMCEADVVSNTWVAGLITAAAALGTTIAADLPASSDGIIYTPVVVSRFLAGAPRVPPVTFDVDSVRFSEGRISQQRRRTSGQQGIKS